MFDFLKDVKTILASSPTTGTNSTSMASKTVDMQGFNTCTFLHTVEASSVATQVTVQGSTSTTAGDFATLNYSSTTVIVSSTKINGVIVATVHRPTLRYLRTLVDSTGTRPYGGTVALLYNAQVHPTTNSSSDVLASTTVVGS